jgi:ABC-2 type transport system permease protein
MMDLREDFRCGWRIARTEVRRSIRWYFHQPRAKIALGFILLVFGLILLFVVIPGAYALGTTVRVEGQFPLLTALRQQMTVLLGTLIVLFALRTVERLAHIDGEKLMLTTTTPRAVVIGLLTAETIRLLLWFGVPIFLVVAAFAIGAQTPALFITVPIGLAPLLAFAAVIGYLLGLSTIYASRYVPLSSSIKTVLYPLALVVAIVGSQVVPRLVLNDTLPFSLAPIGRALLQSPLAAYADIFLLGTPVAQPLSSMIVVVLGVFLVGVPLGFTAAGRLATRFWTTDTSKRNSAPNETTETTPTSVPRPFSWWKSGRIAWQYLRSGFRSPRQFIHIVFLLFAFAPALTTFLESPDLAYIFALGGSIIFGALLAGSTFGLNPFGDEQRTLPLLLLTATPPKQFIRGRLVAGLTACFPFVVVIPFAVAVFGSQSIVETTVFVLVGLVVAIVSATWAVGFGTMFPKYESRKMYGIESVVPSYLVLFGHNFSVGIVGLVSLIVTGIALVQGVLSSGIVLAGIAVALVVLIGTALWAYIYAVRQYRNYSLDM